MLTPTNAASKATVQLNIPSDISVEAEAGSSIAMQFGSSEQHQLKWPKLPQDLSSMLEKLEVASCPGSPQSFVDRCEECGGHYTDRYFLDVAGPRACQWCNDLTLIHLQLHQSNSLAKQRERNEAYYLRPFRSG